MSQGIPQPPPPPPTHGKSGGGSAAIWIVLLLGGGVLGLFCCGGAGLVGFFFVGVSRTQQQMAQQEMAARVDAEQAMADVQAEADRIRIQQEAMGDAIEGAMNELDASVAPIDENAAPPVDGFPYYGPGGLTEVAPSDVPGIDPNAGPPALDGLTDDQSTQPADALGFGGIDLVGEWVSSNTSSIYTIALVDGQPRLEAAVGADGERFEVIESSWDGAGLTWRYRVPSTNYTVQELVTKVDSNQLFSVITSTDSSGNDTIGAAVLDRKSGGASAAIPAGTPAEMLVGEWLDGSTQAVYTIAQVDGRPTLTSVVSSGGEVFQIAESTWDGTTLRWQFRMPSTNHTMIETVTGIEPTQLTGNYTWSLPDGSTGAGSGSWTRRGSAPSAPMVVGEWVDSSTQAVYTIAQVNGQPTLTSAIDDNGEVYEIQESVWDGSTLRWRIRIPSSGYTLTEFPSDVQPNEINGTYTWVDANGGTGEGSSTWLRRSARGSAETIVGDWVDNSLNITHTVALVGGVPTMTGAVDDDAEVLDVLESNWDGAALRAKIRVPSTGYTLVEEMITIGENQIDGTLSSIDTSGSQGISSPITYTRKAPPAADTGAGFFCR